MKVTKTVVGQNVTIIVDGGKFTKRFIDKTERQKFTEEITALIEKIETTKSEKVEQKLKNSLIGMFTVNVKEITKKEELEKVAVKKIDKKLKKEVTKKDKAPSETNIKELQKEIEALEKDLVNKNELIKKLENNDKRIAAVTTTESKRYRGER